MKALILTFQDGEETILEKILSNVRMSTEQICVAMEPKTVRTFPGLEIRLKEQTVYCNGVLVSLSYYEFFTLWFLTEHPGWVYSRTQIYEAVWKDPGEECGAAVSSVISQLRRKLWPENPKGGYIRTVHNAGYKFEV